MYQYKGLPYLRKKLSIKRDRVLTRYKYYEMKNSTKYFDGLIPNKFAWMKSVIGWCPTAVDCIADRLSFHEFKNDNFNLNEIYSMNNADILFDSAMLSALISSCSFIYISKDEDGYPRLQVIDGSNATGIIDPITNLLKEGYAVLSRDDYGNPTQEAYFTQGNTHFIENGKKVRMVRTECPYPLLVPIIYKPDAKRPFGHSRISRASMSIVQSALRTLLRTEVSSEFYSFPQKYVTGLAQDSEFENFKATISSFLSFEVGEDGESPKLGQFQQQTMTPHIETLRMFASMFAGETGLTLDDLGFVSDNPSSAEAIKASHDRLRLAARKAQKTFGTGFLNAGFVAACVRDDYAYTRNQLYLTKSSWDPIFEPDAASLSTIGDGVIKINQSVPGYFNKDNLREMTGIEPSSMSPIIIEDNKEVKQ